VLGCTSTASVGGNARAIALQKECMQKAISQDSTLGSIRDKASEHIELSESIRTYIKGMEAISFTDCPPAFSTAFSKHIEAWRGLLAITDKYTNLRGELHTLFTQLEQGPDGESFKSRLKGVWDTWSEVEAVMKNQ
jgi:hypothetical protein